MLKKILRSPVIKVFAFTVLVLSVFCGVYMSSEDMYHYLSMLPGGNSGAMYRFEPRFGESVFLRTQLSGTMESVDELIHNGWEQLIRGGTVNKSLLENRLRNFIGSVSFSHNEFSYDGGASKDCEYYIEIRPDYVEYGTVTPNVSTFMQGILFPAGYANAYGDWIVDEDVIYSDTDYILVSISEEQAMPYEIQWETGYTTVMGIMRIVVVCIAVALVALICLLCSAGRTAADDEVHMLFIDRMPAELSVLLFLLAVCGAAVLGFIAVEVAIELMARGLIFPLSLGCALCAGIAVLLLMSMVRNIKNRSFLSGTITLRVLRWCKNKLKAFFKRLFGLHCIERFADGVKGVANNVMKDYKTRNVLLVFFGYTVVLAFFAAMFVFCIDNGEVVPFLLGVVWFGLACSFLLKRIKGFDKIVEGIKRLRAGELDYKLLDMPEGVFSSIAEDINSLGDGMQAALETQIRAERMKSELITNVSHDLKTPLTSILNYAELLCQESLSPEEANDYAKIIYQKSLKLKNLTSDLFDISKVQSGAEQMEFEKLDVCTLIRQALAEQEKTIQESGLILKVSVPEKELPIWADGKKLSRAMENLLLNCTKYALKGTRVYLSAKETAGHTALIELKNIANYEMDFDAGEITERFVRGDESRSTEGSGLGLAIAKSYVEACSGTLDVEKDGDLFKVRIEFPIYFEGN